MQEQPLLILDSSPLITLASFPVDRAAIEDILGLAHIIVVEAVASETTTRSKYRDAQVLRNLYSSNAIEQRPSPSSLITDNLLRAYNKLGSGEIETIKLALSLQDKPTVVMDDEAAFVVAHHFGLQPVMLLDLLSKWVVNGAMLKKLGLNIVSAIASRYSTAFVNHTRYKMEQAPDDEDTE